LAEPAIVAKRLSLSNLAGDPALADAAGDRPKDVIRGSLGLKFLVQVSWSSAHGQRPFRSPTSRQSGIVIDVRVGRALPVASALLIRRNLATEAVINALRLAWDT
jgi:hypothetical protein